MKLLMSMLLVIGVAAANYAQAADMNAKDDNAGHEHKAEKMAPHHNHAVEKGTIPPRRGKHVMVEEKEKPAKDDNSVKRHDHAQDRH